MPAWSTADGKLSAVVRKLELAAVADGRENNFDVLRLAAATLVLVSHSFALTGHREPLEPHTTLGTVGVDVFFAISGFLVTKSWLDEPRVSRFVRKRLLRIVPGLVGAVAVTALVVGPALSSVSLTSYLDSSRPWGYIVANVCFLPSYVLSTVFTHNPINVANGSLWTLPVEMRAYLLLALLGAVALVRRPFMALLAAGGVVACAAAHPSPSTTLLCMFAVGSTLFLARQHVVLRIDVALCLLAAWVALVPTRLGPTAALIAVPYVTLTIAYLSPRRLRALTKFGDVSYGVYLYAFPVQQAIIATVGVVSPWSLVLLAAPASWAIGLISWHVIERPMLRLKRRGLAAQTGAPAQIAPAG